MGALTAFDMLCLRECAEQRSVIAALEAALESIGQGAVVLGPDRRVRLFTEVAERLLRRRLEIQVRVGHPLPEVEVVSDGHRPSAVVKGPGGELLIRPVWHNGPTLLLLEEVPPAVAPLSDELTTREVEVMGLLASGRSSKEVARDLAISRRTVDKHVEHIREKLRVTSRSAAIARWFVSRVAASPR